MAQIARSQVDSPQGKASGGLRGGRPLRLPIGSTCQLLAVEHKRTAEKSLNFDTDLQASTLTFLMHLQNAPEGDILLFEIEKQVTPDFRDIFRWNWY